MARKLQSTRRLPTMSGEVGGHGLSMPDIWTFCRHRICTATKHRQFRGAQTDHSTFEKPSGLKSDLKIWTCQLRLFP